MRYFILLCLSSCLLACSNTSNHVTVSEGPVIIFSTDISLGLIDTHGGQGSVPVTPKKGGGSKEVTPQDADDGYTVAMALNLQAEGLLRVDAIVPTFGNATLPAEMLIAKKITYDFKGQTQIPIVPGANAQVSQTFQPAASYGIDNQTVPVAGPDGSFASACDNAGVQLMVERILASPKPVTLLPIGPLTDAACLLTNYPEVKKNIKEIIILASRIEGDSFTINGVLANDFNFRMDPVGGAMFFAAADGVEVKVMTFALTRQTSNSGARHMKFDSSTLKGPNPPTPASERSLKWMLKSDVQRTAFWKSIFGAEEGPFDQYTLMASLKPELFDCQEGLAYIQMCPFPAWSPKYDSLTPAYNAPNNPCFDHSPLTPQLSVVPAELIITKDLGDQGPLIRGMEDIDGNLPVLPIKARKVTVCTNFIDDAAFEEFKNFIYKHTW